MRRARWKRKNVRDELTDGAANSPKTGAGRHELLTELETPLPAALYLNLNQCAAASAGMEHNGVQIGHPLLLFPLPLPRPTPGGVSKGEGPCPRPPSPWGLVSKGGGSLRPSSFVPLGVGFQRRGPRPPAFVSFQGGAGGNRNPPAFLFRGAGGDILFSKENIPLGFCRDSRPSAGADGFI